MCPVCLSVCLSVCREYVSPHSICQPFLEIFLIFNLTNFYCALHNCLLRKRQSLSRFYIPIAIPTAPLYRPIKELLAVQALIVESPSLYTGRAQNCALHDKRKEKRSRLLCNVCIEQPLRQDFVLPPLQSSVK
jgi:hypothetical protein